METSMEPSHFYMPLPRESNVYTNILLVYMIILYIFWINIVIYSIDIARLLLRNPKIKLDMENAHGDNIVWIAAYYNELEV